MATLAWHDCIRNLIIGVLNRFIYSFIVLEREKNSTDAIKCMLPQQNYYFGEEILTESCAQLAMLDDGLHFEIELQPEWQCQFELANFATSLPSICPYFLANKHNCSAPRRYRCYGTAKLYFLAGCFSYRSSSERRKRNICRLFTTLKVI